MKKILNRTKEHIFSILNFNEERLFIFGIVTLFLGLSIFIMIIFNSAFFNFSFKIDPTKASEFGSFVGGFVGIFISTASTILLIYNLINQTSTTKKINMDNKFFKMVEFHRSNVENLYLMDSEHNSISGYRVFDILYYQLGKIINAVKASYDGDDIDIVNIAYTYFFYGKVLGETRLLTIYDTSIIENIKQEFYKCDPIKIFGFTRYVSESNQSNLGHYYRNLYGAVTLIHESTDLSYEQKYDYIKFLRSQLTTQEQVILFFNSMSSIGSDWRLKNLVEEYQLIKNIPSDFCFGFDIKKFYPNIVLEEDEVSSKTL